MVGNSLNLQYDSVIRDFKNISDKFDYNVDYNPNLKVGNGKTSDFFWTFKWCCDWYTMAFYQIAIR